MKGIEILYEDNHLLIVNKPNNIPVQGDASKDKSLIDFAKDYIKEEYKKPGEVYLGLVHRIDRPVSGLVVFARTSKSLSRMNKMFRDHEVKKTYWAIVKNRPVPEQANLKHYIRRDTQKNKSFCYMKEIGNTKCAELHYEMIAGSDNYYLLAVDLKTGRHHQIRAQLSFIGCPIKGDLKYNAKRSNPDGGIDLHSREISFLHPVKKEMITVIAPVPAHNLWKDFERQINNS